MFFRLVTSVGQRKILSSHEESDLRPSDLRSDVLPLSHKDSSVSGVYYEVLMTHILHTARISNVDSVMFLTEKKRWQVLSSVMRFDSSWGLRIFFVLRSWQDEKSSFLILHRAQNLPSLLFCPQIVLKRSIC